MSGSLAQQLTDTAARHGDRTALKLDDAELDYAAFEEGASEAGAEAIIVRPGEFEELLADAPRAPENVERDGSDTAVIVGALPLFHAFGQTCAINVLKREIKIPESVTS